MQPSTLFTLHSSASTSSQFLLLYTHGLALAIYSKNMLTCVYSLCSHFLGSMSNLHLVLRHNYSSPSNFSNLFLVSSSYTANVSYLFTLKTDYSLTKAFNNSPFPKNQISASLFHNEERPNLLSGVSLPHIFYIIKDAIESFYFSPTNYLILSSFLIHNLYTIDYCSSIENQFTYPIIQKHLTILYPLSNLTYVLHFHDSEKF